MVRQSSSSGPCKYFHNYVKRFYKRKKEKKTILKIGINEIINNKVKFQI